MRILAESRPVAAMPFVHLGYLATGRFVPFGGGTLMGYVFLAACLGMLLRRRKSRMGTIAKWVLLVGTAYLVVALIAGHREYPYADETTSDRMRHVLEDIEMKENNTPGKYTRTWGNPITDLPTEAGVHDLVAVVRDGEEGRMRKDGWLIPMKLKVIVTEGQKVEYVLMSAGEDREWNTDDDFTSRKYAERWKEERAQRREQEAQEAATPSTETTPDSREGDGSK
jgi:hypothetical protein